MNELKTLNQLIPNGFLGEGIFSNFTNVPWINSIDSSDLDIQFFAEYGDRPAAPILTRINDGNVLTSTNLETIARILQNRFKANWTHKYNLLNLDYDPSSPYRIEITGTISDNGILKRTGTDSDSSNSTESSNRKNTGTDTDQISINQKVVTTNDLTRTNTGTLSDEGTNTNSGNTNINDKTHGFNSETAVPTDERTETTSANGSSNNTQTQNLNETNTGTIDETTTGNNSNTKTLNLDETTTLDRDTSNVRTLDLTDNNQNTQTHDLTRQGNLGLKSTQEMLMNEIELWDWNFWKNVFEDITSVITLPIYEVTI